LFVAIAIPTDIQGVLCSLCSGIPGARWVKADSMHVTLRFIGEIDNSTAIDLDTTLGDISGQAFNMSLSATGYFSRKSKVRALWAGVEAGDALKRLQFKVERAVQHAGLKPEGRKFKPHVTLARFTGNTREADLANYLEHTFTFSTEIFLVEAFTLFESQIEQNSAHYVALKDYSLLKEKL
tara:strand:- start:570 stop:1112 length:543 start_codon:yes stop_codon:yes gene_type:complete